MRGRRRRTSRAVTLWNGNPLGGLPFKVRMRHCYIHQVGVQSVTGANVQEQVYRLNGMYDPDYTGAGNQPNFFDDLSALYQRYRVRGAMVKICIIPLALQGTPALGNPGTRLVIHAGDDTAAFASMASLSDQATTPYTTKYCLAPGWFRDPTNGAGGGTQPIVFKKYFRIVNFFRDRPSLSANYTGTPTTNPAQQAFLWVRAQQMDGVAYGTGGGSDFNFRIDTQIVYFAEWSEPKMTSYDAD